MKYINLSDIMNKKIIKYCRELKQIIILMPKYRFDFQDDWIKDERYLK